MLPVAYVSRSLELCCCKGASGLTHVREFLLSPCRGKVVILESCKSQLLWMLLETTLLGCAEHHFNDVCADLQLGWTRD